MSLAYVGYSCNAGWSPTAITRGSGESGQSDRHISLATNEANTHYPCRK